MKKYLRSLLSAVLLFSFAANVLADVKVRQKMTMNGQSFETTKMIRGARQRTEQKSAAGGGAADYMAQVATIEQCDLRRDGNSQNGARRSAGRYFGENPEISD